MFRSLVGWMVLITAITVVFETSAARADDARPEEVLKDRGLKRSGSNYILAAELDVQKKVNEARSLSQQLKYALMQRDTFEQGVHDQKAMIQELTEQRIFLNQQLQQNLPVVQHNQLVAEFNIVTDRLNLLRAQAADPNWKQEIDKKCHSEERPISRLSSTFASSWIQP